MFAYLIQGLSLGLSAAASPGPFQAFLIGWQATPAHGMAFLLGFYIAMIGSLLLLVVLLGAARQLGARTNRALIGLSGLALLVFGLYQIFQGLG